MRAHKAEIIGAREGVLKSTPCCPLWPGEVELAGGGAGAREERLLLRVSQVARFECGEGE